MDLQGMGCGRYLLGTPMLPFQSPIEGQMRFEIMDGRGGGPKDSHGDSVRLVAPDDYWPSESKFIYPIFLMPFLHIEQVIVLPAPSSPDTVAQAHQVIIVPTGATGSSPILRKAPEIVSFTWPNRTADLELKGTVVEAANQEKGTYLSVFKRVFNERLSAFGKSVVYVPDIAEKEEVLNCTSTVRFKNTGKNDTEKIQGQVHFLENGLLFLSTTMRLYLPFVSLTGTTIVLVKDHARRGKKSVPTGGRPCSVEIHCRVSEPYYGKSGAADTNSHDEQDSTSSLVKKESTLLSFMAMPTEMPARVKAYASKHSIDFMECEQEYYDFKKGIPMT